MPARRNDGPIRRSRPIPSATVVTSAPVASQTFAISLMKRDARHERGVRGQLHHLRGRDVAAHERRLDSVVELCDHVAVARLEGADDDAVGVHEVLHGGAFGRELRVGHVPDVLEATIVEPMTNSAPGSDRNGALHRDDDPVLDLR